MLKIALRFCVIVLACSLTACMSTFEPRINAGALEQPKLPTARAFQRGVEVSIEEYFSSHKSRRAFDADVGAHGVLPILIYLENKGDRDYRIERRQIKAILNGQPLAPIHGLEAAETGARRNPAWNALVNTAAIGPVAMFFGLATIAASASQTERINRQIEHHFERVELANQLLKPNETATGFVFFKIPSNTGNVADLMLEITLDPELLGDHTGKSLVYRLAVSTLHRQP